MFLDEDEDEYEFELGMLDSVDAGGAIAGNLPDYTPEDDADFDAFIGETADPSVLSDSVMTDEDLMRAAELEGDFQQRNGGNFEQQAIADMRANALAQADRGPSVAEWLIPAIAGASDLFNNEGRGLGPIAGAAMNNMQANQAKREGAVDKLGRLGVESARQDRLRQDSERGNARADAYLELNRGKEARLAAPKTLSPLQQRKAEAEVAKLEAEAKAVGQPSPDLAYRMRHDAERDKKSDANTAADNARANAALKASEDARNNSATALKEQREQGHLNEYNKQYEYELAALGPVLRIQELLGKYPDQEGVDLPASGLVDSFIAQADKLAPGAFQSGDDLEMDLARQELARIAQRAESGAAGPNSEFYRYASAAGSGIGTEEGFRKNFSNLSDYMRNKLSRGAVGREDLIADMLSKSDPSGSQRSFVMPDYQPPAPPPVVQPAATAGRPGADPLANTGQPAANGGELMYEGEPVSPEEYELLRRHGYVQ